MSALRHSWIISSSTLLKVTQHILSSGGRPHCHCEDVPLQFVFGPEQSMEKFKEARAVTQRACFDRKSVHLFLPLWPQSILCAILCIFVQELFLCHAMACSHCCSRGSKLILELQSALALLTKMLMSTFRLIVRHL